MKIDEKDKKILRELQENCMQSTRKLGRKLKMPATTLHQRMRKLKKEGVIKSFGAVVEPEMVDYPSLAFILIRTKGQDSDIKIAEKLSKIPGVLESHVLTGRFDLLLKIRGINERKIGSEIISLIRSMKGISSTETFIVVDSAKETSKLDI